MKACITGGGGYVGFRLGKALLDAGYLEVLLLDLSPPAEPLPPGGRLVFSKVDVRDAAALAAHFHGASVVFHAASYGMSGSQQLQRRLVAAVNVGGTQAVLQAAVAAAVPRLVYLSTYNVVYGGQTIEAGDESLPYFPFHQHPDVYSRTKALAEQAVLAANMMPLLGSSSNSSSSGTAMAGSNGSALTAGADAGSGTGGGNGDGGSNGKATKRTGANGSSSNNASSGKQNGSQDGGSGAGGYLRTCAIRPAGIWGPGELRHQPRIVRYLELGLFAFVIGQPDEAIVDFVHVDNLVQACILAAEGLTAGRGYVAAGQAYFIHDDCPGYSSRVNNFQFYGQLVRGMGYRMPTLVVPLNLMYCVAWAVEVLHAALWPVWDLSRLFILTRAEALKAGGTHWFVVDKAKKELGYRPVRYSFQPVVDWFLERGHGLQQRRQQRAEWRWRALRQAAVLYAWWLLWAAAVLALSVLTAQTYT